jgi:tetratricopeptide (TPR) repeat protein
MNDGPMYPFLRKPSPLPALRGLQEIQRKNPQSARAASDLALAHFAQEDTARALRYIQKAVRLAPHSAEYHFIRGQILLTQERLEEAANAYERALELESDHADWCCILGKLYAKRMGDYRRALPLFQQAIRVDRSNAFGYVGVGRCAIQERSAKEAAACARKVAPFAASELDLDRGVARALEHYGRYEEALESRREILRQAPGDLKTLNALGRTCDALGDQASALQYHEQAFRLDPRHGESFYYHLFKLGEFERAREVYWAAKPELRQFAQEDRRGLPRWQDSAWHGRTVLLDSVGGYGDSIQFARFAALLRQRGARVVFQCQKSFCSLASTVPGIDLAIARHDEHPPVDCELVLFLETHHILGFDLEESLGQVPYLQPPERKRREWSRRLADVSGLKVGICWCGTGSGLHNPYAFRGIPLSQWRPLLELPGVSYIGLQRDPVLREVARESDGIRLPNLASTFADFADTAAVVLACDLVITVDTSVAHLAGALGKPVFAFIPFRPCYRWQLSREDTFWYPGMRLFRQERPGDWNGAIARVRDAVCEFRSQRFPAVRSAT